MPDPDLEIRKGGGGSLQAPPRSTTEDGQTSEVKKQKNVVEKHSCLRYLELFVE